MFCLNHKDRPAVACGSTPYQYCLTHERRADFSLDTVAFSFDDPDFFHPCLTTCCLIEWRCRQHHIPHLTACGDCHDNCGTRTPTTIGLTRGRKREALDGTSNSMDDSDYGTLQPLTPVLDIPYVQPSVQSITRPGHSRSPLIEYPSVKRNKSCERTNPNRASIRSRIYVQRLV